MATRAVLAELAALYRTRAGQLVEIESVGGVDAAKRVASGEAFDVVILASDAIAKLETAGHVAVGSAIRMVRSGMAVAARHGQPHPAIVDEASLRAAVLGARSIGYSTGPSGTALLQLFERWGIAAQVADRLVQARPGVPVGSLVAKGEAELGFQQASEFVGVDGIDVLGPLPPAIQVTTVFSAALATTSTSPARARAFLEFLASSPTAAVKQRHGMEHAG